MFFISIAVLVVASGIGSVYIPAVDCVNILLDKLFNISFKEISDTQTAILWNVRIPRTILAYICGAGLAVSGTVMQSVLRNPLASSYTLGVSSGAALGAGIVIFWEVSFLGIFTLTAFGLTAGILTVVLALLISAKLDKSMNNNTIILLGMAFSLFANALLTLMSGLSKDKYQQLIYWQMGSLASKGDDYFVILIPIVGICIVLAIVFARHLDIMTLGDEQARVSGVNIKSMKWFLMCIAASLTGAVVSVVGVIGFLDIFTPHAARKFFGSSHKYLIPASAMMGGSFLVICDLVARTIIAPSQLPVGAITGVLGAPFFIYLYFGGKKKNV